MKKILCIIAVLAFLCSCAGGHKSQPWHPHEHNTPKPYKPYKHK